MIAKLTRTVVATLEALARASCGRSIALTEEAAAEVLQVGNDWKRLVCLVEARVATAFSGGEDKLQALLFRDSTEGLRYAVMSEPLQSANLIALDTLLPDVSRLAVVELGGRGNAVSAAVFVRLTESPTTFVLLAEKQPLPPLLK